MIRFETLLEKVRSYSPEADLELLRAPIPPWPEIDGGGRAGFIARGIAAGPMPEIQVRYVPRPSPSVGDTQGNIIHRAGATG